MRSLFVSHIVLTTEDVANVLLEHLREYDDPKVMMKTFARLAKKYSACGSRHKGGELGWMEVHTSAPEFFHAAQAAKVMELSGPVKTTFGYHIFIITEEEAMGDTGIDGLNVPSLGAGDGTL
jgi:parvulin-like peptidyl-prolyl isomerase